MKKFVKPAFALMVATAFTLVGCKHSTTEPEASYTIITFKANGGVGDDYTQEIPQGSTVKLKANLFTREDYIFDGWCVSADGDGTLYEDGADFTMTEANEIALYAQWLDNANFIAKQILNMTEAGTIVAHGKLNNESISVIKAALLKCKYDVNLDLSDVRGLTKLEDNAFESCYKLNKIQLPNGIIYIGDCAFFDCEDLYSITIPSSVESIGYSAFNSCGILTNVTIENGVKTIGEGAFSNCGNLASITIPNSVKTIVQYTFSSCANLTNVTIENGVKTIGEEAFSYCPKLTSITIPGSVNRIGGGAFGNKDGEVWSTSLEKITFTDTESTWYRTQWGDFTGGDEIGPMPTDPSINAALFNTGDAFYKKTN